MSQMHESNTNVQLDTLQPEDADTFQMEGADTSQTKSADTSQAQGADTSQAEGVDTSKPESTNTLQPEGSELLQSGCDLEQKQKETNLLKTDDVHSEVAKAKDVNLENDNDQKEGKQEHKVYGKDVSGQNGQSPDEREASDRQKDQSNQIQSRQASKSDIGPRNIVKEDADAIETPTKPREGEEVENSTSGSTSNFIKNTEDTKEKKLLKADEDTSENKLSAGDLQASEVTRTESKETEIKEPTTEAARVMENQSKTTHNKQNVESDRGKHTEYVRFRDSAVQNHPAQGIQNIGPKPGMSDDNTLKYAASLEQSNSGQPLIHDNVYFTGRLPSLLTRENTLLPEENNLKQHDQVPADKTRTAQTSGTSQAQQAQQETQILNEQEPNKERKPSASKQYTGDRRTPSASRKIRELIKEINTPAQLYHFSREARLSPKHKSRISKSATNRSRSNSDDAIRQVEIENKPESVQLAEPTMTVADINQVTSKVLNTTHAEDYQSQFNDLPQMKSIDAYIKGSFQPDEERSRKEQNTKTLVSRSGASINLQDESIHVKEKTKEHTANKHKGESHAAEEKDRIHAENDDNHSISQRHIASKQYPRHSPGSKKSHNSKDTAEVEHIRHIPSGHSSVNRLEKPVQRSSSENDLKEIIASAKIAIGTNSTTPDSQLDSPRVSTFSVQGDSIALTDQSHSVRIKNSAWKSATKEVPDSSLTSLICSRCLQVDSNVHAAGFCTQCQQYLCGTCVSVHTVGKETNYHEILPSYCKLELENNKYVPATGYCADCSSFLCPDCVIKHTTYRANRRHRIVQSSFLSKQLERKKHNDEFLDAVQEKMDLDDMKSTSKATTARKRKRKKHAETSYPYRTLFNKVSESLYPGPNKKLATSYVQNPKWAHSSIPNLPYLIQPNRIPDPVNKHVPFEAHKHPTLYVNPTKHSDIMMAKLKMIRSRYKVKDWPNTARRREADLYTARPLKQDSVSLPDIHSFRSRTTGRSRKHTKEFIEKSSSLKNCEFVEEHCLTIPFPRGEKRTEIFAMTVLSGGKLTILDKMNNNIKLFTKAFHCKAALQFHNRLVDIDASNLTSNDLYAATPKHIYEISAEVGLELTKKIKVEIKRIEGLVCWKYGVAVISKKTHISWELRLLDYRGNPKSKLEIFNPFELEVSSSSLHHMTMSRAGKYISISDIKNSCVITVDVLARIVVHETVLDGKHPGYLTADCDADQNLYVTCDKQILQLSKKGKVVGVLLDKTKDNGFIGCIAFNKMNNRLYVQTGRDTISVYQTV